MMANQFGVGMMDCLDGTFEPWDKPRIKPMTDLPTAKESNPLTASRSRLFVLRRDEDETGISGTGVIAEGIEFSTGWCALSWMTSAHSVGIYPNIKELERIHGHNGRACVVWK